MSEKKYMVFSYNLHNTKELTECRANGHSQGSRFMTEEEAITRAEKFGPGPYKIFELVERTVQTKKGLV